MVTLVLFRDDMVMPQSSLDQVDLVFPVGGRVMSNGVHVFPGFAPRPLVYFSDRRIFLSERISHEE